MSDDDPMESILRIVREQHHPLPPASREELDRLSGLGASQDVLRFYGETDGCGLHRDTESGGWKRMSGSWWHWVVVPISQLKTVRETGYIQPESPFYERSAQWLGLVDVQDGNFLALSVEPGHVGEVIDCFHETVGVPGYSSIIALSFTELLGQLVRSKEAFWLQEGHREYGVY